MIYAQKAKSSDANSATLIVVNHVNDTLGGKVKSEDFKMIVTDINFTKKSSRISQTTDLINGSETGNKLTLSPGTYGVFDNSFRSKPMILLFNKTFSVDCHPMKTVRGLYFATGLLRSGDTKTCFINRVLPAGG